MTIDKTDVSILEQIEKLPLGEDIEQIRDSVELSLNAGNLARQKAEIEKVSATSEIKEKRIFSKEDVSKLIVFFAMANKLEPKNLEVIRIINNKQGELLVFEVKYPNPDGGYQFINYIIKGRHGGTNQSGTTRLDRDFCDKDGMPEGGDTIAEYLEGKWRFDS
ncbi:hypothetical protein KY331_03860 [Candidatus Woesearchaeota archaeon]|nr:hypothetical protein [Candidatus Woesearchaeota archaeon]